MNKENLKTTSAPSVIWRLPLTPIEKILLFNLAYLERDGKVTNKSQALLAHIAGVTTLSVNRCISNMEKNGWLSRTKMFAQSDIYTINWDMIIKEAKESDIIGTIQKNIKQKEDGTFEKIDEENVNTTYLISSNSIDEENSNTADLSHSNSKDVEMYHQELEEPTDRLKMGKEEEIEVVNNNINEEEIDMIKIPSEFSENLTSVINNNEAKIEQMAKVKFNRKYLGLKDETSFKLCKQNYEIITKQLTTEKDRTDFDNFLNYKVIILYNKQYQTT